MKIIDKINARQQQELPFFSFEYFPPKTEDGVQNLYDRLERMAQMEPLFADVTWGAGGSTSSRTLEICDTSQNIVKLDTQMHLTCTNLPIETTKQALITAKEKGIQNILALRGDPPRGEEWKKIEGGFGHAVDLVRYIRKEFGDYFGVAVAGYPEGHQDAVSYEQDLQYLKQKVDAGADFIVTQLFYDVDIFLKFVKDCRDIGITCPIIPGIMPIHSFAGFKRMTTLSQTKVPQYITDALEPIQNDEEAVKEYGVKLAIEMCQKLLDYGIKGLHFYTLNLEKSVTRIVQGLGLTTRRLPWQNVRDKETIRPIFWVNRPKSYLHRTASWDEFPNGRWGDSRSPAYGDLTDYHLNQLHYNKALNRQKMWGEVITSFEDVKAIFVRYLRGEIPVLPWVDTQLAPETDVIKDKIIQINERGFLTINSQPCINGASSSDPVNGWGGTGGYVYQKAYVEFFASPEDIKTLINVCQKFPSVTYHAIASNGESYTNTSGTNAITWGVFPGKEIIQPTVCDSHSFTVWKDEAFALWKVWAHLYDAESSSAKIINNIHATYFLVNLVDNDFVKGNIFAVFDAIFHLQQQHQAA